MYIKNKRDSSNIKVCSHFELSCKLINDGIFIPFIVKDIRLEFTLIDMDVETQIEIPLIRKSRVALRAVLIGN